MIVCFVNFDRQTVQQVGYVVWHNKSSLNTLLLFLIGSVSIAFDSLHFAYTVYILSVVVVTLLRKFVMRTSVPVQNYVLFR